MSDDNPFAALIQNNVVKSSESPSISGILEEIFAFTLDPNVGAKKHFLYLEEVSKVHDQHDLDVPVLQHALFERLLMCNGENPIIKSAKKTFRNSHSYEVKVITYLCNCYRNINEDSHLETGEKGKVKALVVKKPVKY